MDDLLFASIAEQRRLIRGGEVSPVELTQGYLARIEEFNGFLNAYITLAVDEALAAAVASENRVRKGEDLGLLDGIPYGVKDQILTAGIRTTAGSGLLRNFVPSSSATVVNRMQAAGAVLLGKHNLDEWGKGGTVRYPFGEPRNPWNLDHIASGSSSGSGIATAAGLCSAAIGEDTGGSIRQPAAANGVVGLRPTFGRVSRWGALMYGWNMDCLGPITRTVEDSAILLNAIAGHDPQDPLTIQAPPPGLFDPKGDLTGRRIGVVTELAESRSISEEVLRSFRGAVKHLESLGASVDEVSLPLCSLGVTLVMLTTDVDVGTAFLGRWLRAHWSDFDRGIRRRLAVGALVPAATYQRAMRGRALVRAQVLEAFRQFDALVCPTNPNVAPRIDARGSLVDPSSEAGKSRRLCVYPFSIANTPAISVPCGFSASGLPIGLQIAGRPLDEATVFEIAGTYETTTKWHTVRPDEARWRNSGTDAAAFPEQDQAMANLVPAATLHRVRAMADAIGLRIPDEDLPEIALRLDRLLQEMDAIDRELGTRLDEVEPVPPILQMGLEAGPRPE